MSSSLNYFPIANVQCHYDSLSDSEPEAVQSVSVGEDHTYGARDEPPAFIIHHIRSAPAHSSTLSPGEVRPKIMTIGPGYSPSVNVIHVGDQPQMSSVSQQSEYGISKRIRRSEVVLRQAADCVSRGLTFQTVSEQFNIPISTIRFFMARKGILPRRRRGRTTHLSRNTCTSPEPPYHMQHFKLPDMIALKTDDDEPGNS